MRRYAIETDAQGRVTYLSALDAPKAGQITIEGPIPEMPDPGPGEAAVLCVEDGRFVYRLEPCEPPTVPGPDPEPPSGPTHAEVEQARQAAYRERVDPLTAEIARLRDMAPGDPRIAEAEAEREVAVAEIVAANPYPEEEDEQ